MDLKQIAGEYAATFVKDGMKIGLGTGSTAYWTIQKLGQRVKEGLSIQAVPTSKGNGSIGTAAKYSVDFVKRRTKS